jgi:hypothetical protein
VETGSNKNAAPTQVAQATFLELKKLSGGTPLSSEKSPDCIAKSTQLLDFAKRGTGAEEREFTQPKRIALNNFIVKAEP